MALTGTDGLFGAAGLEAEQRPGPSVLPDPRGAAAVEQPTKHDG
jgi:hypothetical protein